MRSERHQYTLKYVINESREKCKYLFNKSAKLYLPGCFSLRGPPLKRKRSCLIAVDQINAITSRMTDSERNAMKFNIKTERKYIPNFTGRFFSSPEQKLLVCYTSSEAKLHL